MIFVTVSFDNINVDGLSNTADLEMGTVTRPPLMETVFNARYSNLNHGDGVTDIIAVLNTDGNFNLIENRDNNTNFTVNIGQVDANSPQIVITGSYFVTPTNDERGAGTLSGPAT